MELKGQNFQTMDQGTSNENCNVTEPKQAETDSQRTTRAILTLHGN